MAEQKGVERRRGWGMLKILIDYDLIRDSFCINGNVKMSRVGDLVTEFLKTQVGAGEDNRKAETKDLYKIDILLDLSQDIFRCSSNCGNLGLREGILLRLINRLE